MTRTDRLVALGATFLILYVGVLVWHGPEKPREAFPAFNWSLFSKMPSPELTDYSIRFTSINGEELPKPLYLDHAQTYITTSGRPEPYQLIQELGKGIVREQPFREARAKQLLDSRWLEELSSAEYEIVQRRFDVIERSRCDCYTEEIVLKEASLER